MPDKPEGRVLDPILTDRHILTGQPLLQAIYGHLQIQGEELAPEERASRSNFSSSSPTPDPFQGGQFLTDPLQLQAISSPSGWAPSPDPFTAAPPGHLQTSPGWAIPDRPAALQLLSKRVRIGYRYQILFDILYCKCSYNLS